MSTYNGLGGNQRFVIPETVLTDGKLPPEICGPVRDWLKETADQPDRRVAVLTQTMAGVLDTFRTRVPALAAQIDAQVTLRSGLTAAVNSAYQAGLAEIDEKLQDGSLMSGEVLARWQAPRPGPGRGAQGCIARGDRVPRRRGRRPGRGELPRPLAAAPGGRGPARPAGRGRRPGDLARIRVRRGGGADLRA